MSQADKNSIQPPEGATEGMSGEIKHSGMQPAATRKGPPPEIKLPFEKRKHEPGEWVYDNRVSVFVTVIIYLAVAILFVSAGIVIDRTSAVNGIAVELEDLEKLQKQLDEAKELNRKLNQPAVQDDRYSEVRNIVSNENARVEQLHDNDRQVQEQLRESREMYEESLREQQQLFEQASDKRPDEAERQDVKVKGNVTVSFSLVDPIRSASGAGLFVPAYRCQTGGRVVVEITVNQNGDVTAASVLKSASSSDYCMTSTALDAALRSRFNVSPQAPSRHTGTITYIFIPQ